MLRAEGMLMLKVGAKTASFNVVEAFKLPDVPVIVTVLVPRLAVALAVNTNIEDPVVGLGEKDAVTPLGSPVAANETFPVNPYSGTA